MPTAKKKINPRAMAAQVIEQVLAKSRYLDTALTDAQARLPRGQAHEAALIQEMAYGTLRWFHQLEAIARQLLARPLKPKDQDIHALLLLGLYQLRHMRTATHAAVTETVEAAEALKKPWAKNLLNACLRSYL
ncbi:MAG: transcription antitermination factor NusB, partial [Pseudomonadota bacterium]